jgi:hypothetical protein
MNHRVARARVGRAVGCKFLRTLCLILAIILEVILAGCTNLSGPPSTAFRCGLQAASGMPEMQRRVWQERNASAQCAYQIAILQDRRALYPGYISMQKRISLPVGQERQILVTVCGSAITACSKTQGPLSDNSLESPRLRARLLAGARIEASLEGEIPGGIQAMSLPVQLVIAQADAASWSWMIQPDRVGIFHLILSLTPLLAGSGVPLHTSFSYLLKLKLLPPHLRELRRRLRARMVMLQKLWRRYWRRLW